MKRIAMGGTEVVVTDGALADLVMEYAKELGRAGTTDTVTVPAARAGEAVDASMLLGPASQITVTPAPILTTPPSNYQSSMLSELSSARGSIGYRKASATSGRSLTMENTSSTSTSTTSVSETAPLIWPERGGTDVVAHSPKVARNRRIWISGCRSQGLNTSPEKRTHASRFGRDVVPCRLRPDTNATKGGFCPNGVNGAVNSTSFGN